MQITQTGLWRWWAVSSALKAATTNNPPTGTTCSGIIITVDVNSMSTKVQYLETACQPTMLDSKSEQLVLHFLESHPLVDIDLWWQIPFFNIWSPECGPFTTWCNSLVPYVFAGNAKVARQEELEYERKLRGQDYKCSPWKEHDQRSPMTTNQNMAQTTNMLGRQTVAYNLGWCRLRGQQHSGSWGVGHEYNIWRQCANGCTYFIQKVLINPRWIEKVRNDYVHKRYPSVSGQFYIAITHPDATNSSTSQEATSTLLPHGRK
jgi:hypothetical protein